MNRRQTMLQTLFILLMTVGPGVFIFLALMTDVWEFFYYGAPLIMMAGSIGYLYSNKHSK